MANLRRRHSIEDEQHGDEPEDGVNDLDWKLHRGEQQWEEAHVASDCQRSEGAEVSSVFEGEQAEWYDDQKDGFLVDVPPEEEGCIAAERNGGDKGLPGWMQKQLE